MHSANNEENEMTEFTSPPAASIIAAAAISARQAVEPCEHSKRVEAARNVARAVACAIFAADPRMADYPHVTAVDIYAKIMAVTGCEQTSTEVANVWLAVVAPPDKA